MLCHMVDTLMAEVKQHERTISQQQQQIQQLQKENQEVRQNRIDFLNKIEHHNMAFEAHNAQLQLEVLKLEDTRDK